MEGTTTPTIDGAEPADLERELMQLAVVVERIDRRMTALLTVLGDMPLPKYVRAAIAKALE